MRRFFSYGPIDTEDHYYAPRNELIEDAYNQLLGENPQKSGHYITVWAPRQCGKTWVMQEVVEKIRKTRQFEVGIISMQSAKKEQNEKKVLDILMEKLQISFDKSFNSLEKISDISRLFTKKYFYMGKLYDGFADTPGIITGTGLDIPKLIRQYEAYLKKNREWLLKDAPRRADLRIFEAVYHFNLFSYLKQFVGTEGGSVLPEFPTGNGKIDLIVNYAGQQYGLEVKSFTTRGNYGQALERAAQYGKQMGMSEIFLVFFVDVIDEENRGRYEKEYRDEAVGVNVVPIFVETGEPGK